MYLGVLNKTTIGHNTVCEPNVIVNTNERNVKKVDKIIVRNSHEKSVSRSNEIRFFPHIKSALLGLRVLQKYLCQEINKEVKSWRKERKSYVNAK